MAASLKSKDVETAEPSKDESKKGAFARAPTSFRNFVTADGSSGFPAEAGRYHLYISHACPWAHRCVVMRALKGLEEAISVSSVHYHMDDKGWKFDDGEFKDPLHGRQRVSEIYFSQDPEYQGRFTVPILFDKKTNKIVSNESSEIIRMFNSEFSALAKNKHDFFPQNLKKDIEEVNGWVYPCINDGVYRCGFAGSQEAYDSAFDKLFPALEKAEALLSKQRYLAGDTLTEADIRLFTTLLRFDAVYHVHFKCNKFYIRDKPNLLGFLREIYQLPGVKDTWKLEYTKAHYYGSHFSVNPKGIIPKGPELASLDQPHGRGQ